MQTILCSSKDKGDFNDKNDSKKRKLYVLSEYINILTLVRKWEFRLSEVIIHVINTKSSYMYTYLYFNIQEHIHLVLMTD